MNVITIWKFLLGEREAIVKVVSNEKLLWVGAVLVLSAGFAREYDAEDLLHSPSYLLIPFAASLVSALLLFGIVSRNRNKELEEKERLLISFRAFLTAYWMMAPMAWLYAIPVERFLPSDEAVRVNLYLLGIVSLWRVLLISRVISVTNASSFLPAFFIVMFFADSLALIILYFTPLPVFNIMGGIPQTLGEQMILNTGLLIGFWGVVTFPLWGSLAYFTWPAWRHQRFINRNNKVLEQLDASKQQGRCFWGVYFLAASSLLVWIPVLPITQPEQQNQRVVDGLLNNNQVKEAIRFLSSLERGDLPSNWDSPPHIGYGERTPRLADLIDVTITENSSSWVKEYYVEKLYFYYGKRYHYYNMLEYEFEELDASQIERLAELLEEHPEKGASICVTFSLELFQLLHEADPFAQKVKTPEYASWRKAVIKLMKVGFEPKQLTDQESYYSDDREAVIQLLEALENESSQTKQE